MRCNNTATELSLLSGGTAEPAAVVSVLPGVILTDLRMQPAKLFLSLTAPFRYIRSQLIWARDRIEF